MNIGEVNAMQETLRHIQGNLDTAAGSAVAVELRMRLLAELSEPLNDRLKVLVKEANAELSKKKIKKKESDQYWNCNLHFLDQAIQDTYYDKLKVEERQKLETFRKLRNKLLHASFVKLMIKLNIPPLGREIIKGVKKPLSKNDIRESIISIDHKGGLGKFRILANQTAGILDKILYGL